MSLPLVSILVPVFGVEKYIERCVRSIMEQTYSNIEIIFVDDCSPDRSIDLLITTIECYPAKKNLVHIIHHEKNRGLAASRNTALGNCNGDFIVHVDSDDWLEPDAIDTLVEKQQETNADIVSGNALRHTIKGDELLSDPDNESPYDMTLRMLEMDLGHTLWRRLIRRSLFTEHNVHAIEGANVGEDHLMMSQLAYYAKNVAHVDKVVYHYNCMNIASYMSRKKHSFSWKKYHGNITNLNAIFAFFKDKDKALTHKVLSVKQKYLDYASYITLVYGSWHDYRQICKDMNANPYLPLSCIRHVWREIKTKLMNRA